MLNEQAACVAHSSDDLVLFPGFTIRDNIGSKQFFWGPPASSHAMYPRVDVLSPDGCKIQIQPPSLKNKTRFNGHNGPAFEWQNANAQTEGYTVGYYHLGPTRPAGARPMQDLNIYSQAAVKYYRQGGVLVEDLLADYLLTAQSTSVPIPVVMSEITSAAGAHTHSVLAPVLAFENSTRSLQLYMQDSDMIVVTSCCSWSSVQSWWRQRMALRR